MAWCFSCQGLLKGKTFLAVLRACKTKSIDNEQLLFFLANKLRAGEGLTPPQATPGGEKDEGVMHDV